MANKPEKCPKFPRETLESPVTEEVYNVRKTIYKKRDSTMYVVLVETNKGTKRVCKIIPEPLENTKNEFDIMEMLGGLDLCPPVYEWFVFEFGDKPYGVIVMEYYPGGDLFDFVTKNFLVEAQVRRIFHHLLTIGSELGAMGILHRDFKLENFLMDPDDKPKVIDFGLATRNNVPDNGAGCGSLCYAAPEVLNSTKCVGNARDAYSLGVTLFTMVVRQFPFANPQTDSQCMLPEQIIFDTREKVRQHLNAVYESNPTVEVSNNLKDLILGLLDPDPAQRITINEALSHAWFGGMSVRGQNSDNAPDGASNYTPDSTPQKATNSCMFPGGDESYLSPGQAASHIRFVLEEQSPGITNLANIKRARKQRYNAILEGSDAFSYP